MKSSIVSLLAIGAATVAAQAPPMPTHFNFARCGMNTMVSGIAQSGCSVTDSQCLCKAKSFQKAGAEGIPNKCPSATDQSTFINFINAVCQGQQGYPLQVKERSAASSLSLQPQRRRTTTGALIDGRLANTGVWTVMSAAVGAVAVAAVAL